MATATQEGLTVRGPNRAGNDHERNSDSYQGGDVRQQSDYYRPYESGRGGTANRRSDAEPNIQLQGRDFSSGRFPAPARGIDSSHGSTTVWPPSSSSNIRLVAQVAERVMLLSSLGAVLHHLARRAAI